MKLEELYYERIGKIQKILSIYKEEYQEMIYFIILKSEIESLNNIIEGFPKEWFPKERRKNKNV